MFAQPTKLLPPDDFGSVGATGENESVTYRYHRPMLPAGRVCTGPNADLLTMLYSPVMHSRHNMAAAATSIIFGTMLPPSTGTRSAIESQVNVIFSPALLAEHLEPIGANSSNRITATFFLNFLSVSNSICHYAYAVGQLKQNLP